MSVRLPAASDPVADPESGSESEGDDDQEFGDWVSDSADRQPCKSLFGDDVLPSAAEAVAHDKQTHGFDLDALSKQLALDFHGRVRLINYIRKEKPSPSDLSSLQGSEPFLASDGYLKPALEDDPLLQYGAQDAWSDDDDDGDALAKQTAPADLPAASRRIAALERKLAQAKQDLTDYRTFVGERLDSARLADALAEDASGLPPAPARDDDSHYFQSYGENDIHAVMIQDRVRTSTYASFIMRSPALFRDAIVLDVGCGTGILSLFAARAGAKRVFAVDASPVADKAAVIVRENGLEDVITVIRGKIEEVELPFPPGHTHVDIIVSEWMGYALLYESMLDSVLAARDRFLRPPFVPPTGADAVEEERSAGVMAPSQCRMLLGLCDGKEVHKERVGFWNDVYGFDLSAMASEVYDEAIVDIVSPESMLSDPCVIKDIYVPTATVHTLSFSAPFSLVSNSPQRTRARALVLHFDTFFAPDGGPVPADARAQAVRPDDAHLAEVWPLGSAARRRRSVDAALLQQAEQDKADEAAGERPQMPRKPSLKRSSSGQREEAPVRSLSPVQEKAGGAAPAKPPHARKDSLGEGLKKDKLISFSTGPESVPTHWKQTIFLLREPIPLEEGTIVQGTFHCRKSTDNKRELDVEIHYEVLPPADAEAQEKGKGHAREGGGVTVQMFKVR